MGSAGLYLVYAAVGKISTGHNPFFWMDEDIVGSKEKVAAYCTGFVAMAGASEWSQQTFAFPCPLGNLADFVKVFSMLYGLVGMRESVSRTH